MGRQSERDESSTYWLPPTAAPGRAARSPTQVSHAGAGSPSAFPGMPASVLPWGCWFVGGSLMCCATMLDPFLKFQDVEGIVAQLARCPLPMPVCHVRRSSNSAFPTTLLRERERALLPIFHSGSIQNLLIHSHFVW